jgi:hypothetical protein
MQLNTLNRVIALFLIGGFVVLLVAVAFKASIWAAVEPYSKKELSAVMGVVIAVALLSVTAFAGSLVDAVGNLSVRRLIRFQFAVRRPLAALLGSGHEFDERDLWQEAFERAMASKPMYETLLEQKQPDMIRALSAAIFFRTANKEHAEWLIQHHSMYHLSANFVVILFSGAIWALCQRWCIAAVASVVGAYFLTSFSLDNYLYTYQLSFRHAYITITDPQDTSTKANAAP